MNFIQSKLNVQEKSRTNIFNWRGQFTPQFVEYVLDSISLEDGAIVADPFAGSGTVLIETIKKGYSSIGVEINPAAYHMSRFFEYSLLSEKERIELLSVVEKKLLQIMSNLNGEKVFIANKDYRLSYNSLIETAEEIKKGCDIFEETFLINMLFSSEKDKRLTIKDSLSKSYNYFKKALNELPFLNSSVSIAVENMDARNIGANHQAEIDLIITSPPYINVFNYHQNYRAITEAFGYKVLEVAHSEFGSNRKNRGNRILTVIQYCIDMEASLVSFWNSLKDNGTLVIVVGRESNVRKIPFYNSQIITDIIEGIGGYDILTTNARQFGNKFGQQITEDIIVARKIVNQSPIIGCSKNVAKSHLVKARKDAPTESLNDLNNALMKLDEILPSPIYNTQLCR